MMLSLAIIIVLGLALGSFVNVCAYRIPRGISVVSVPSSCPHCHTRLSWVELIPLLSFALQRGRCASCERKISWRYPISELFAAAALVLLYLKLGASTGFVLSASFILVMAVVAVVDWEFFIIPNRVLIVGGALGLALKGLFDISILTESLVSAFLAIVVAFSLRLVANALFRRQSLGMGDVKLAALVGFFLGVKLFFITFWIAAIFGLIYGITKAKQSRFVPLGSMMGASSYLVLLFHDSMLALFSQ